jgi:hypothetical protein
MLAMLREKKPEPTPIADTLRDAARLLDLQITEENGLLAQAQIIRELARRVVELEDRE